MTRHGFVLSLMLLTATLARADKITIAAGGGTSTSDGPATQSRMVQTFGVDFGADGTIYIVEMAGGERLLALDAKGNLRTLAGTFGKKGTDDGPAAKALFNGMHSLAVAPDGAIYLADTFSSTVRKYDPKTGAVTTFAGTGGKRGFSGDGGPAAKALFNGTFCISFDPAGKNLYVTDLGNARIRKIDMATGVVTTVAGNGKKGRPKDGGNALEVPLSDPRAHAIDGKGNLYILERGGNALRVVNPDGNIKNVVGGEGKKGADGVGGPALQCQLNGPKHISIDKDGTSVLIADTENHRVLRYVPGKEIVEHLAGTGKKGNSDGGGDPKKIEFSQPHGVIVHPKTGDIYISDANNGRALKLVRD